MTIMHQVPLQMPWITLDPFLFCVHHLDNYPKGNGQLGVSTSLKGRNMGSDFSGKDGWSMYHGSSIPGFPSHPHRGFETITIGRQGYIDHSDSLGAKARFGQGDVQWMTAGKGIVHSEMFPLIKTTESNPTELFQIWLNLPAQDKMVAPYFTMFWEDTIRIVDVVDDVGLHSSVQVVAGDFQGAVGPTPPPNSWASRSESDIAIWSIQSEANANLSLPSAKDGTNRVLYFFKGTDLLLNGQRCTVGHAIQVRPTDNWSSRLGIPLRRHFFKVDLSVSLCTTWSLRNEYTTRSPTGIYRLSAYSIGRLTMVWMIPHGLEGRFAVHADGTIERRG